MRTNRKRGGLARLRGRLATGLLVVTVLLTGTALVLAHASSGHPAAAPSDAGCVLERNVPECRVATTPSGQTFRYAVLRSGGPTLLLDIGGPGASLFGAHWPGDVHPALPTPLRNANLVMIEELWVTSDVRPLCRQNLTVYYQSTHNGHAGDGAAVSHACLESGIYGWTASGYREAVEEVSRRERLTVDGFLGASFAGRRLGYLAPMPLRFAAIVSPAPLEMAAGRYLAERHDALVRLLASMCSCRALDVIDAAAAALDRAPVSVSGRSVSVTGADVGAAVVALGYQPDDVRRSAWAALVDPVRGAALLGQLSDTVWGRYGVDDLSPSWLAYLSEVCRAYPGWPSSVAPPADPVSRFLFAYHAPCTTSGSGGASPAFPAAQRICVVGSPTDPVTPASFAESWRRLPNVTLTATDRPAHGDLRALSACF